VYTLNTQRIYGVTMILAVGNIKGGVGKTMLAVNIAVALAHQGRDVLLIDGDEQASAATFARIRAELPVKAGFTTIQLQGAAIRQQMRQLAAKYDRIIIDVGGRDTGSLRAALTVADAILIPFQPRSVDLWTGAEMSVLIGEAVASLRGVEPRRSSGNRQRRSGGGARDDRVYRGAAVRGGTAQGLPQRVFKWPVRVRA
jgi:hypothetical protein